MIGKSEEAEANASSELECAPSGLEDLMSNFRAQISLQLIKAGGRKPLASVEESEESMQSIINILLDQNEQLVSCLAELEREAVKRTVQMQKRLRSTASATRETVCKMSEWGEEIRDIISKKHLAEEAAFESKCMVDELQKENSQLRSFNENLCSDIQSLLNIISVARASGNWEMDCVTFCVISPEDVYGPICRLSGQHPDGMAIMDVKPDNLLKNRETEGQNNLSESLPALSTVWDESVVLQNAPRSVESFLHASRKTRPRNVRRRLDFGTAKKMTAPKNCPHCKHLGATIVKRKSSTAGVCSEVGTQTREHHSFEDGSPPNHPVLLQDINENTAIVSTRTDAKWEEQSNLSESLPALSMVWDESMVLQDSPRSVESFLRSFSLKTRPRKVRHRLDFGTAKKMTAPKSCSRCKHLSATVLKRKSSAAGVRCEVGTQTREHHSFEDGSPPNHPMLLQDINEDTAIVSTRIDAKWEGQSNLSESLPALSTVWDESVILQDTPRSVESFLRSSPRKARPRSVRRRLDFGTAKKMTAPKNCSGCKHLSATIVKRKSSAAGVCCEVGTQTTVSEVGIQIAAYHKTFEDASTQVDQLCTFKELDQDEGSTSIHTMLLHNGDEKKSTAIVSTQTDAEWEKCLPSGNEKRDQELCSLKDRLALAIQEVQSKALLAMELQMHLDTSAKEVEFRDKIVQNLERKLSLSRQETEDLKKELTNAKCELEIMKKASEKTKAENDLYKSELEKMSLTVKHLQDALVELKKNSAANPPTALPKVHDV